MTAGLWLARNGYFWSLRYERLVSAVLFSIPIRYFIFVRYFNNLPTITELKVIYALVSYYLLGLSLVERVYSLDIIGNAILANCNKMQKGIK